MKTFQAYDIIGDIHGQVGKLVTLLARLGYHDDSGVFRHDDRQAVFVGDFIDRGPNSRKTLHIVRAMVEGGAALAVIGNHEFNALAFDALTHTADAERVLRQQMPRRLDETLDEFRDAPQEWREFLDWFRRLPLYLELPGFRVVHAAWCPKAIQALAGRRTFTSDLLREAVDTESPVNRAVRTLLEGWQVPLPDGSFIEDREASVRDFVRLAWWKTDGEQTYRRLSLPYSITAPELPLPGDVSAALPGYPFDAPPVFIGHYCLPPDERPWPLADNIACVDYSAGKHGTLVAYRWDGERVLKPEKFVT